MELDARPPFGRMRLLNIRKPDPELLVGLHTHTELQITHLKPGDLARIAPKGLPNLQKLSLRHFHGSNLEILKEVPQLKVFEIWQSEATTSLDGLEHASSLAWLNIVEIGEIASLEPIATLTELSTLLVTGGVWKNQLIRGNLKPLANLQDLQSLSLSVEGQTDLTPILGFRKLQNLWLNTASVPIAEVVKLAARYPFWHKENPWLRRFDFGMDCPGCGRSQILLMLKKTKRVWCESCDGKRLSSTLAKLDAQILSSIESEILSD
jgi:hypothetical protein